MIIKLSPVRSDEPLSLAVSGDTLLINDVPFTVMLPYAEDASEAARFPQPISVVADGPVELPK